jgi:iron complex transport system substrate-binding protein
MLMAEALNKTQEAKQLLSDYNQRVQTFKSAMRSQLEQMQISLAYLFGEGSTIISIDVKNSFGGSILQDAGLKRPRIQDVVVDGYQIYISAELLSSIDADVLFLFSTSGEERSNRILKQLHNSPLWKQLKVVQQNRVYIVDHSTWRSRNILAANAAINVWVSNNNFIPYIP